MKVRALAVAALMSAAMPAAVLAQANTTLPAPTGQTGINAGADVNAGSSMGSGTLSGQTDFNAFLHGFEGADFTSATSGIDTATSFNVVKISTLKDADATKLKSAITPHQQDIASLTSRISGNAAAKAALDAQGLSPDNVVWIESGANGAMTLYVDDMSSGASGSVSGAASSKN